VVIQDVATGAVERRIATGEQIEPGKVAASADDLGHLVLVFAGATARAGGLVLIDAASGTVQPIAARTTCPATTTP
jgi:carotenoid cleavage dioxygenase-like enzyme